MTDPGASDDLRWHAELVRLGHHCAIVRGHAGRRADPERSGGDATLSKPFGVEDILAAVRRLIGPACAAWRGGERGGTRGTPVSHRSERAP